MDLAVEMMKAQASSELLVPPSKTTSETPSATPLEALYRSSVEVAPVRGPDPDTGKVVGSSPTTGEVLVIQSSGLRAWQKVDDSTLNSSQAWLENEMAELGEGPRPKVVGAIPSEGKILYKVSSGDIVPIAAPKDDVERARLTIELQEVGAIKNGQLNLSAASGLLTASQAALFGVSKSQLDEAKAATLDYYAQVGALRQLEDFTTAAGADLAGALRGGVAPSTILAAGYSQEKVEEAQQYIKDYPLTSEMDKPVSSDLFVSRYFQERGWELPKHLGGTLHRGIASESDLRLLDERLREASTLYKEKFGTGQVLESGGVKALSTLFPITRSLYPEVTLTSKTSYVDRYYTERGWEHPHRGIATAAELRLENERLREAGRAYDTAGRPSPAGYSSAIRPSEVVLTAVNVALLTSPIWAPKAQAAFYEVAPSLRQVPVLGRIVPITPMTESQFMRGWLGRTPGTISRLEKELLASSGYRGPTPTEAMVGQPSVLTEADRLLELYRLESIWRGGPSGTLSAGQVLTRASEAGIELSGPVTGTRIWTPSPVAVPFIAPNITTYPVIDPVSDPYTHPEVRPIVVAPRIPTPVAPPTTAPVVTPGATPDSYPVTAPVPSRPTVPVIEPVVDPIPEPVPELVRPTAPADLPTPTKVTIPVPDPIPVHVPIPPIVDIGIVDPTPPKPPQVPRPIPFVWPELGSPPQMGGGSPSKGIGKLLRGGRWVMPGLILYMPEVMGAKKRKIPLTSKRVRAYGASETIARVLRGI